MTGKFIVVYGMNNIGKTTAVRALVEYLNAHDVKTKYLKYPIYDLEPTGPRINAYLRQGNPERLTPFKAQVIYAQNRRDFQPVLKDTLEKGIWIIAEDYSGTGEGWGVIFGEPLEELERLNVGLKKPDLAILMDGERFDSGVEKNHLHEQDERWEKGREIFRFLAERNGWRIISSEGTKKEVLGRLVEMVDSRFKGCIER